jgi:hypothetical protein
LTEPASHRPAAAAGEVAAPARALSTIPVPLAELFTAAVEHERGGRFADAERLLGHILAAEPEQADALHLAGIVAFRRGRPGEALDLMRRSLDHGTDTPLYWRNICEVLRVEGHLDEALDAGRRAVRLNPDDAVTLSNLAMIHAHRLELDDAEACGRLALELDPGHAGAHFGLAEVLLLRGDMERGWDEYEWRFRMPGAAVNLPPGGRRQWMGRPLPPGRLLVVADQGYGDAIQFGRYLPQVLERCPEPLVAAGHDLHGVLRQLGALRLHDRWDEVPDHDAYATLSGLPRIFGTRVDTIPARVPYLRPEPAQALRWAGRLGALLPAGLRRVGLAWAGRPTHANDRRRSTTLAALARLFALPGIGFVSLQKGERQAELARYFGAAPLVNLGPELRSWDDTMAVLVGLDAVVTVDTAVAHLAGALGRPVHVMLPHAGEWRWLLGRNDSPWYPTMRLHRQPVPGNWDAVGESVARALAEGRAP